MRETVSVVISAYNEGESVNELHKELGKVMKDLPLKDYELIFVDDGSKDDTYAKCQKLQEKDKHVKIVHLRRNFGHEVAMTAGMDYAKGDAVVFMDADLQHPPVYIKEMVKYWQEGTDIVLTKRVENQATSKFYDMCAALFYKVLNFLSDTKIPAKTPDFRLIDRSYIDFLKKFSEHDRLFRGLLSWAMPNDNVKVIDFVAPDRFAGVSKYNFGKSLALALNSIVQFSTKPLRLSIYLGLLTAFISGILGLYVIVEHFVLNRPTPGYATIMTTIIFIGSVQLIVMGIIGEYIGKIHMEVKNRPLYIAEYKDGKKE
ncbi:MAG: glycosyltransferase family 2 protein [bacterium]|nr:glycosyltransferase family 2 protein [bacterium]MDY2830118.1 glycosyltransferase family 2 protein [Alphaproteobacteria bacterium]